jgi:Golgi nucleoside diphosphatase
MEGPSDAGPCGSSVRIITGEEEGLFGWIAVNYLMDGFSSSSDDRTTYGFLDMGGASTQIAFEPSPENQKMTNDLIDVRLRLLGGEEIHHKVFVTTWLGYGTNQARERYAGNIITEHDSSLSAQQIDDDDVDHHVPDPCLPRGLELTEHPVHLSTPTSAHLMNSHRLVGTGSFEECLKKTAPLLNTSAPCPDTPCLMNGVHVPPIDFSVSHFIGVSEYWYSSEHIFGLGGAYDFVQYERAASDFCSRDWKSILSEHEESQRGHRLGGDGEVLKDGKVVEAGKWGPNVEIPRLQMQCFKAAWVTNVLHEGIKLPRIVDPGGNVSTDGEEVEMQAKKKGLGRPAFQSMDSVGDIAISWTLGKMVLEASKEVLPIKKSMKPIVDPIDDIEDIAHFPIQPIRPPFLSIGSIEEKLAPHLPHSLTRDSLGFSLVSFVLYAFAVLILLLVHPLRRRLRVSCLRTMRIVTKRESAYTDLMEEGHLGNGRSPSPSTGSFFLYPIRRVFGLSRPVKFSPSSLNSNNHMLRHLLPNGGGSNYPSSRPSPTLPNLVPVAEFPPIATSTQYDSRSPSPAAFDENVLTLSGSQSSITSRSRNASQVNLSNTLASTRAGTISRSNSLHHVHGKFMTQ